MNRYVISVDNVK